MYLLAILNKYWLIWYIIDPIYVIRTGIANSSLGVNQSIFMDYIKKKDRGKWMSISSISRFGWSGSSLIGGWIVSKYGF